MTLKEAWDYIQAGGLPTIMAGIGYALHRGWLVLGREAANLREEVERERKEKQRWQDEALHLLKVASQSIQVASQSADVAERHTRGRGRVEKDVS